MKKIYVLATALLLGVSSQAQQQTIGFESVVLSSESYDNGAAGNGDFLLGADPISFSNIYDPSWGSWTGFSISNVTDNTTSGWGNQYSAFTGSGYYGSSNYAIGYGVADVLCENEYQFITSFKITNSTYTGVSMRDGDAYAKQFGSVNNASGTPDGTNGEDFYRVWVYCEDYSGANTDSVEVMLADYRFADDTQDYIVDTWLDVDLQSVSFPVSRIQFRLESSDIGDFGMNTPAYYAIDNIVSSSSVGLVENELMNISTFPNPVNNLLRVEGDKGLLVLTDLNGGVIFSQKHTETSILDFSNLSNGVYILSVTNTNGRFSQKILK
jgi:hypothetical protein